MGGGGDPLVSGHRTGALGLAINDGEARRAVVLGSAMSSFSNCSIVFVQRRTSAAMRSRALALTSVLLTPHVVHGHL